MNPFAGIAEILGHFSKNVVFLSACEMFDGFDSRESKGLGGMICPIVRHFLGRCWRLV